MLCIYRPAIISITKLDTLTRMTPRYNSVPQIDTFTNMTPNYNSVLQLDTLTSDHSEAPCLLKCQAVEQREYLDVILVKVSRCGTE
jgi:hypothetical protein